MYGVGLPSNTFLFGVGLPPIAFLFCVGLPSTAFLFLCWASFKCILFCVGQVSQGMSEVEMTIKTREGV